MDETGAPDRRAELIAAALTNELTDAEQAELAILRDQDPSVDLEIEQLREVADGVATMGAWWRPDDAEDVVERAMRGADDAVASAAAAPVAAGDRTAGEGSRVAPVRTLRPREKGRRRRWPLVAGAAACLAVGLVVGVTVTSEPGPPDGPPGTLGAVEEVDFAGEPDGVSVDGDLVAHTWGTETLLTIDGLPTGAAYEVVVIGLDGSEYDSGTFLGSDVTISCAMNAATLREDVAAVEIRDGAGAVVAAAVVPPVEA